MEQESKIYPYEDALKASTEYFNGDTLAATVFLNKYAMKDADGNLCESTPKEMHHRLAAEYARIESKYPNPLSEQQIFDYLDHFRYIVPAGSPMSGIGNNYQKYVSLANCFVIGSETDSYNAIHYIDSMLSAIMKRRGGCGCSIDFLRPAGAKVDNAALTSTGMASFMERFSSTTREVAQGGRRGAAILLAGIKHPDAEAFIDAKLETNKVTGANISVKIDDEFMECVLDEKPYTQQFPLESNNPIITKTINAHKLWNKIIHNAWKSAEPGVLFWDTVLRETLSECYADDGFHTIATNPCAELILSDCGACILSSVNLFSFVKNPFTSEAYFDFEEFRKVTTDAQRLVDDLLDLEIEKVNNIIEKIESEPDPEELNTYEIRLWRRIKDTYIRGRRTGLGITAEGDMLAALGLTYGTKEASDFAVKVHQEFALSSVRSSINLAKERGAFPIYNYEKEINAPFLLRLKEFDKTLDSDLKKYGRRNIGLLTIAPNGSVSIMTQTTSGIEPVFMPVYKRRRKVNPNEQNVHVDFVDATGDSFEEYIVFHPKFKTWMEINGYDTEKRYTQKEIDELVEKSPYFKATANDVDWKEKVRMQGEIQKYIDHSISVTVNLPNSATEELVNELYITAWKSGCKGCTIYRDGSRDGVLVSATKKKEDTALPKIIEERPKSLAADVIRFKNNKENWIAFVGKLEDGRPYEIFTGLIDDEEGIIEIPKSIEHGHIVKDIHDDGTKSYDFVFTNKRGTKMIIEGINNNFGEYANYSKMLSSVLRYNMPMNYVFHLVDSLDLKEDGINSWKSGVKRALKKFIKDGTTVVGSNDRCPDCGEKLIFQDGCVLCPNCGYSKCG
jgi:ribonucleoside-diphosphate reductase alpha chain